MLRRNYEHDNSSAARALEQIGERWSLLIIRNALHGIRRFSDFQRGLGVAPNVLTKRLESFVKFNLMERRSTYDPHSHHEYVLTDKGHDLAYVVIALTEWGDRWVATGEPPTTHKHEHCGGSFRLQLRCGACGETASSREIKALFGRTSLDVFAALSVPYREGYP